MKESIVKQHLICGSYEAVCDYFKKVIRTPYDTNSLNDCYEIPTMPVDDQLKKINESELPKLGLVFYFSRVVVPKDRFEIIPITEAVYISDEYVLNKFNEITQYFDNTDVMEGKLQR